jgi:hypothetical protein
MKTLTTVLAALLLMTCQTQAQVERFWPDGSPIAAPQARKSIERFLPDEIPTTASPPLRSATLAGSPMEIARLAFEEALRAYNGKKVRTQKELNYVLGLRSKYVVEYKREFFPPPEYDRPYTGKLTIERVADPAAVKLHCPELRYPVGCAKVAYDLSSCVIFIVSDEFINRQPNEIRRLFAYSYENFLRHELAHCNGWPADHPH